MKNVALFEKEDEKMLFSPKYMTAAKILQSLLHDVRTNPEQMKKALATGSNIYRLPFESQLMVYHCKPEATMVASYDQWNRLSCAVRRGSHGIALPNEDGTISYVFDVEDTVAVTRHDRRPVRWKFQNNMTERIMGRLDHEFGLSQGAYALSGQIMALSERFAREMLENPDFRREAFENGVVSTQLRERAERTMASIMAYTVMRRMDLDTEYFEKSGRISFDQTNDLPADTFQILAGAISKQAAEVLHAVALEVTAIQRERRKEYDRDNDLSQGGRILSSGYRTGSISIRNTEVGEKISELYEEGKVSHNALHDGKRNASFNGNAKANVSGGDRGKDDSRTEGEVSGDGQAVEGKSGRVASENVPDQSGNRTDDNGRNYLYLRSIDGQQGVSGLLPVIPDQAEQFGMILAKMARDDAMPSEIRKAMDTMLDCIPSHVRENIALFIEENGNVERTRNYISQKLKQFVPVLNTSSEGICVADESGEHIDLTWDSVAIVMEQDALRGRLADERTLEIIRGQREKEQDTYRRQRREQEIRDRGNAIRNLRLGAEDVPFKLEEGSYAVLRSASVMTDINDQTQANGEDGRNSYVRFAFAVYREKSDGRGQLAGIINHVIKNEDEADLFLLRLQEAAGRNTGIDVPDIEQRMEKNDLPEDAEGQEDPPVSRVAEIEVPCSSGMSAQASLQDRMLDQSTYDIYQLRIDKELESVLFLGMNELEMLGRKPEAGHYQKIYSEPIQGRNPETIYNRFHGEKPDDFGGRSLSVSDVILMHFDSGEEKAYFIDDIGFKELPGEFVKALQEAESDRTNEKMSHDGTKEEKKEESFLRQVMNRSEGISPIEEKRNYCITDSHLGEGLPREKIHQNIEAITLLKELERNEQAPSLEQKEILSRYVGWGGLADIFDDSREKYHVEREKLHTLLTEDEYRSARASVKDSFYTAPVIMDAIYDKLADMGLERGKMLEPSCGIGNFIGKIPEKMQLTVTGVELDTISGHIARMLYPESDIQVRGFENTAFRNNTFDVAVGNVPFGDIRVHDREYRKEKLLIHDYFFVKSLDKLKPGGIAAFITSSGTMDKKNSAARHLISEKADFLGAVRMPNTAFKKNAGTEVTTDILFLQKKKTPDPHVNASFVETAANDNGIHMNRYFVENPGQICGHMEMVSGQYGFVPACLPDDSRPLSEQLRDALKNISGRLRSEPEIIPEEQLMGITEETISEADARNFSYVVKDGRVYYREDTEICTLVTDKKPKQLERIKACAELRDKTRELLEMEADPDRSDQEIHTAQKELLAVYERFQKNNGRVNDKGNRDAFKEDDSYYLLCSLEKYDDNGKFAGLADIFTKRTVEPVAEVTAVETAHDALVVSLNRMAEVDIPFMAELCGKTDDDVIKQLTADKEIFLNPETNRYESADEYLSGNVRLKLRIAKQAVNRQGEMFKNNVSQLKAVQPPDIPSSEITVRLGATWIDSQVIEDFMRDVLKVSPTAMDGTFGKPAIHVSYNSMVNKWFIEGKHSWQVQDNTEVNTVYGVEKANALDILEKSLNLKTVQINIKDEKGNVMANKEETEKAQVRQKLLEQAFKDWVFTDPERRKRLTTAYNERFNCIRPRTYDGSNLSFEGMNPNIKLKQHQKDAVARQIYGGNTLLAHCVGAGKTFTMAAAGMEMKRIGICKKPLYVVPKAVVGQWANEFATLYPAANILVAGENDFTPANRKKFTARIATGDYDAVIISHSQFEKIALSREYQEKHIQRQIDEAVAFEAQLKADKGDRWSVKQMEGYISRLKHKLTALNDISRDDVVDFETLGVDYMFVDESHNFKNLPYQTKMTNVAGLGSPNTQKCVDMLMKCDYLNERTGNRGITFATGTPVSNTMAELYANMKYLQPDLLEQMGCSQFDEWAANFGSTRTCMEFDPTGQHFQLKTRFAEFFNLPELMTMFKECADVQTADMIQLKVPEAQTHEVVLEPSDVQKRFLEDIVSRCRQVKDRAVEPMDDNMLKITSDGRMLAFDQRMLDPLIEADADCKIAVCVEKAFEIYQEYSEDQATQIIFSDLGVPPSNGSKRFNAYQDIKDRLIEKGVPDKEIAIIHDYASDKKKDILQRKMRSGQIRILIGSTQTCGTGLNVQTRLRAVHHLDVPWRPSDIEQREGRIIRQGNMYEKVDMYRYVTKNTFDTFSWQTIKNKQHFVSQIMTSQTPVRCMGDIDAEELQATTAMALASGNPKIIDKVQLEKEVNALRIEKASHRNMIFSLQDQVRFVLPQKIDELQRNMQNQLTDSRILRASNFDSRDRDAFRMLVAGGEYRDKKEAGEALIAYVRKHAIQHAKGLECGEYKGFPIKASYDFATRQYLVGLQGKVLHSVFLSDDPNGMILRLDHALEKIDKEIIPRLEMKLADITRELQSASENMQRVFPKEDELQEKEQKLAVLTKEIENDLAEMPVIQGEDMRSRQTTEEILKASGDEKTVQVPAASEKNIWDSRKHEFSNFEMAEGNEAGKYNLTAEVNMGGRKQRVVVTASKSKEELIEWAEKNDVRLKDHSRTVKGRIQHQHNIIALHDKSRRNAAPLNNSQAI